MTESSPRYRIIRRLGKGGMGEVFLAEDTVLERRVALKFLPDELRHDARARERFEREAKSAAALDHPFICKIHEIATFNGETCIVMEYVEGETLLARTARGRLASTDALQMAEEIAEALDEAHRRRILHRDLKPANVMLTAQGHVKVMDFGLAKQLPPSGASHAETRPGLTEAGVLVGTPDYMSPEQVLGAPLDERSDMFSFGVVLYELLAGVHPFARGSQSATLTAILREPPPPVTRYLADVPTAFDVTLGKLLTKDPADRYQTFRDIYADLRGLRWQLAMRQAAAPVGVEAPPSLVAATRTTFVGREAERGELRRLLDQASQGRGSLVLIGGEPGVGKTRLVEETLLDARRHGFLALAGHCYETAGTPPFIPFVEFLEHSARVVPTSALREALGDAAPEVAKLMPELRRMFPDIPPPLELPPEQQRRYLFNSFLEFVERGCRVMPQAVLMDDLHWADEPTLLLLQHLAQRLPQIPMLVLGTYRDVELDVERPFAAMLETLTRQRLAQRLALRRLPEDHVRAMLAALSGNPPPDPLVRIVYHETEGNPFFVEEVFHHLAEEGKLFDEAGHWRAEVRIDELDVPEGVRLVIGRRLQRLREETVSVLTSAALVGRRFDLALLEAISAQRSDAVLETLEEAEAAQVIRSEGGREAKWSFAHELIRQTLVGKLSLPRRQRVHQQIAETIERVYASALDQHVADVAHHLYQAGAAADRVKTVRYLMRAGDQSLAASAFEEALRNYDVALSLGDGMPPRERADLLVKRGQGLCNLGRPADAIPHWQEALSIYERLGEVEATARLCYDMSYQLIWLNRWRDAAAISTRGLQAAGDRATGDRWGLLAASGLALGIGTSGDYEAGTAMLQEAREGAERLGDRRLLGQVLSKHVMLCHTYGESGRVVDLGERAAGELRRVSDLWELAGVLGFVVFNLTRLGRLGDVAKCNEELKPLAVRVGHHGALGFAEDTRAECELMRTGDLDAWEAMARDSFEAWQRAGLSPWIEHTLIGITQFWKGQWQEARASFECAIRSRSLPAWNEWPWGWLLLVKAYAGDSGALPLFATRRAALPSPGKHSAVGTWYLAELAVEALAILGERREAHALYPTLVRVMEMRVTGWVGLVPISAGIAAACGGDWDRAEQHYQTALRQAHEIPHKIAQPDTRRWYGQMLLDRNAPGDRARARTLLGEAVEMYRTIGMPKHLEMAETLLLRAAS